MQKIIAGILIFIASTIHTIALVLFIPYALMIRSKGNSEETDLTVKLVFIRAFTIAIAGFIGYSLVMQIAIKVFPTYAFYLNGSLWSDSNYNAALFNTMISVVFAVTGAIFFKDKKLNSTQRFAAIMLGLNIIFNALSMRMEIWGRIAGMFGIYTYLLWVPEFTSEVHGSKNRWILNSGIVLFAFAYMVIILTFRPEWTQVVPYLLRE